jgi:protein involved in polysaccharide export with SLBB domain
MKYITHFAVGFLGIALIGGCQSPGPRFDPYQASQPEEKPSTARPSTGRPPKMTTLDEQAFITVESTNMVRSEWLKPPSDLFRLGPSDVVEIELLGDPLSRTTTTVGPDGKIYFNLTTGMFAWGLTLAETKQMLEKELTRYVRVQPEVVITLKAVGSRRLWVLGNVQTPGVYSLATPTTVLEAIALAGGISVIPGSSEETADLQNSFVMRGGQMLNVNFHRLLRMGDLSQNIYLQPDDFVFLRSSVARTIYVMGAVAMPSAVPYTEPTSLVGAITSAGGTISYAYVTHVAVLRGSLTSPRIAIVDFGRVFRGQARDVRLEPGDIVYVPFVPYRKLGIFGNQILNQFVNTVAVNEGRNAVIKGAAPVGPSVSVSSGN